MVIGTHKYVHKTSFILYKLGYMIMSDPQEHVLCSRITNTYYYILNSSRPTSRTSNYCSLSVSVEHEDFIVGIIDYHYGGNQTKVNVLVNVHGYESLQ